MIKNTELVTFAVSKIGCGYIYGFNGQVATKENIEAKRLQYKDKDDGNPFRDGNDGHTYAGKCEEWIGVQCFDCSGLIDNPLKIDKSADGYYALATIKDDDISTIPQIPGILVHKSGHIGVSKGNGKVVEARGVDFGVVETDLKARGFYKWSQCPFVDYAEEVVIEDEPIVVVPPVVVVPVVLVEKKPTKLIKVGAKGGEVLWIQNRLIALGYSIGSADGEFGPKTLAGVTQFQTDYKLEVDGIVGAQTVAMLANPVKPFVNKYQRPPNGSIHKKGMKGVGVLWIQTVLKRAGYNIVIDSDFGSITDKLVRDFQSKNGLLVDGIVGTKTLNKLDGYNK